MPTLMKPKGIHCRNCGSKDVTPDGWYNPVSGLRVRYFKCNKCERRFKTEERFGSPIKSRKS